MSDNTGIEWADATWNPVTGCTEVSDGCDHCYAKTFAERWRGKPGHYFERGFDVQLRPNKLSLPLRWTRPRRIFVNSMSDLFHDAVPDEYIARVFAVMARAPRHTFQVLTKRHARMRSLLASREFHVRTMAAQCEGQGSCVPVMATWPLPNVWLGVSVEDQRWADIRIPALLDTPAAVRWLSCEPLLGPVDLHGPVVESHRPRLTYWLDGRPGWGAEETGPTGLVTQPLTVGPRIDWVVAGGESGPGARPMHPDWARSLRDQCVASGVPFLFKQWGEWGPAPWSVRICDPKVGWLGTDEELAAAKRDAEARGATHCLQPWGHVYEPNHKPWSLERDPVGDYPGAIRRWGKKAAGRTLDGRTWDQYPGSDRVIAASTEKQFTERNPA